MKLSAYLLRVAVVAILAVPTAAQNQKQSKLPPKILSAKSIYFDDQSDSAATGKEALDHLKKWGRFQIVNDRRDADLIFLRSAQPYKGGYIIFSGGQTGTIDNTGNIEKDRVPTYNKAAPVRYAFLTVIDPQTGENLWSDSHEWGGLLTGFSSSGARLINKLRKQIEK